MEMTVLGRGICGVEIKADWEGLNYNKNYKYKCSGTTIYVEIISESKRTLKTRNFNYVITLFMFAYSQSQILL